MSHFSSIKTTLIDKQALVEGLKSLLASHQIDIPVEIYESPMQLFNDYDRRNTDEGEIIIRRTYLKTRNRDALVDVGFANNPTTNAYEIKVDAWDFNQNLLGSVFGNVRNFQESVQLAHNQAYINIHYPPEIWDYQQSTLDDGSLQTTLTKKVSLTVSNSNGNDWNNWQ